MNHVERFYRDTTFPHIINLVKIAVYTRLSLIEKDWTRVIHFNRQPKSEQELCASTVITSAGDPLPVKGASYSYVMNKANKNP